MDPASCLINVAKTKFPEDVVAVISESGIAECDPQNITREDINSEFKDFKFNVRKRVYEFFKSYAGDASEAASSDTQSDISAVFDTSISSADTEPNCNAELHGGSSFTSCGPGVSKSSNLTSPPANPISMDKQLEEYPGHISSPFPINEGLKQFLQKSARSDISANRSILLEVVREITNQLKKGLGRMPNSDELLVTAKRFCQEYPVVQCGNDACYGMLLAMMKRRVRNSGHYVKTKSTAIKRKLETTDEEAHRIINAIHNMDGKGIAERCHQKFPSLKEHNQCLLLLATIIKKDKNQMFLEAEDAWRIMTSSCEDDSPFKNLQSTLNGIFKYCGLNFIIQNGTQYYGRPDIAQPFLLIPCIPPAEITVMIDEIPFLRIPFDDSLSNVVVVLLSLLATYYILNLEYPTKAKKAYKELERMIE